MTGIASAKGGTQSHFGHHTRTTDFTSNIGLYPNEPGAGDRTAPLSFAMADHKANLSPPRTQSE